MRLKYSILVLIYLCSIQGHSDPSYEVLKSCIDESPQNASIKLFDIEDRSGFSKTPESGCTDQYEMAYEGKKFGGVICNENFYIIVNGKKILAEEAIDLSVDPSEKPGHFSPHHSFWWKIEKNHGNHKSAFLCIATPYGLNGSAAAQYDYYIIENAFSNDETPKAYFYYFGRHNQGLKSASILK